MLRGEVLVVRGKPQRLHRRFALHEIHAIDMAHSVAESGNGVKKNLFGELCSRLCEVTPDLIDAEKAYRLEINIPALSNVGIDCIGGEN